MDSTDLESLKAIYEAHRQEWLNQGHQGEWAVVVDSGAHGFYATYEAAFAAASEALQDAPFLLQEVLPEDRIEHIQLLGWAT